jgi:hypothetical protein
MIALNSPHLLAATAGAVETGQFVAKVNQVILFPLITLLTGIAMLYFVYGAVVYIINAENSSARETGRRHIIYGIVGLLVMLVAYAILTIAANTIGSGAVLDCANKPDTPGCFQPSNYVPSDCSNGGPC